MAQYPSAAAGDSNLYIAVNKTSTTLTDNPLAAGAVTVNVLDASAFPSVGAISIDAEIIHYTGKTGTSFTGCTRGFDGTTGVSHAVSTPVYHKVIADHHNALKEEIKAVESDLVAVKAALNDADTPAATATDVKDRLDQVVSQLKLISGGANWYTAPAKNLTELLPLSGGTMTGNLLHPSGSSSAPSVTFSSYSTTGLYAYTGGGLGLTAPTGGEFEARINNVQQWLVSATQCFIKPQITASAAGTASAPDYSFLGDTDTGIYRANANAIGFSALGINRLNIQANGLVATVPYYGAAGSSTTPTFSFDTDTNTGIYLSGTDQMDLVTGGVLKIRCEAAGLGVSIAGATSGGNAAAGYVGEYVSSAVGTSNFAATGTYDDGTSISLTAGDWDVSAEMMWELNGATGTEIDLGISTTSGNSATGLTSGTNYAWDYFVSTSTAIGRTLVLPLYRMSLSATTTVYLKRRATYSAGTPRQVGSILRARRVR